MGVGFSHNGKTLLSGVDPAGRATRIAEAVPVLDRTLYLCPSPLYGYGLERLLSRIAPGSILLCIEAEPDLFTLSQEHLDPLLKNNAQLHLTNQCDAGMLCALVRQKWGLRSFRRVEVVRLNGGWQLFPALYDTITDSLRKEIAINWGNAMTLSRLGRRYIRNAVRNLALIPRCPSLDRLSFAARGAAKGAATEPVLVLGAGPSLDSLLDALPAYFGEALWLPQTRPFRIICVDTCLPALRERGITPDLAVILESQHWNLEDFAGLCGWNVPAVMDLSALPRSGNVLSGELFLFFTPWTKLAIFERLGAAGLLPACLPPLGSVGLSAAYIARQLTCGTIITAGLDFSFTLDSYHARSTPGHKRKLRNTNRFKPLLSGDVISDRTVLSAVSKNGGKVYSSLSLRNYRDLFEREFGPANSSPANGRPAIRTAPQIFTLSDSGLPLGIKALSLEAAFTALGGGNPRGVSAAAAVSGDVSGIADAAEKLRCFVDGEQNRLILLRDMLTGDIPMDYDTLCTLIAECDYLWAHFPDYAAAGHGPNRADLEAGSAAAVSFLKRLRVEIDPFLTLWEPKTH